MSNINLHLHQKAMSKIRSYELEMMSLAGKIVKTLMDNSAYNKQKIANVYDKLLDVEHSNHSEASHLVPRRTKITNKH